MRRVLPTLRSRLMGMIAVALVPVVAAVVLLSVQRREDTRTRHREDLLRLVHNATREPSVVVAVVRTDLELLSHVDAVRSLDAGTTERLFRALLADREYVTNLALVAPDGRLVASARPVPPDADAPGYAMIERVLAERRFVVGRPHVGPVASRHVVPVAGPVPGPDGAVAGVLFASLDVGWFGRFVSTLALPPSATAMVIGRDGEILVCHPDPHGWTGRTVADPCLLAAVRDAAGPAALAAPDPDGVECTWSVGALCAGAEGPAIVMGIPAAVSAGEGRRVLLTGLVAAAAFAALCAALAWWASGPLVFREYGPLLSAVRRFEAGDLSARTGVGGREGELAEIARTFDAGAAGVERLTREQSESEKRLRALARRLQTVRDEEQARIARELHDEFGQSLTALKLGLERLKRTGAAGRDEELAKGLEELLRQVDATFALVRRIASELRPPLLDHLGLTEAARWHVQEFARTSPLRCSFDSSPEADRVDGDGALAAFRVMQESLTNVSRHAAAKNVHVALRVDAGTLVLDVEDDGRGLDASRVAGTASLGIMGMRERAEALGGSLEVGAGAEGGTRVRLRLPPRGKGRS